MQKNMKSFKIGKTEISEKSPVYFIADIAANHDGEIQRAFDLIALAKEAGADAAKFQHFRAEHIVSDYGFKKLGSNLSHQANWSKSVFEVYKDASLNWDWTPRLAEQCRKVGIDFFSSPYDFDAIDHLDPYVPAYKIGSGDITWPAILEYMAKKDKPIILATGASSILDVVNAVDAIEKHNKQICLMQCNTNYTGGKENLAYISLNVLKTFGMMYPDYILGLSDHTYGHTSVLGAVALGARVIEKHFTDDNNRKGPDHGFSMNYNTWKEMVERTRELEIALGSSIKRIEENEKSTVVLQRRCLRAAGNLKKGHVLTAEDISVLRPAPEGSLLPDKYHELIGKKIIRDLEFGQDFNEKDIE
jgi:N-acetylneuraminate synthase